MSIKENSVRAKISRRLIPMLLLFSVGNVVAESPQVVEAGIPSSMEPQAPNNSMLEMLSMLEQLQQDMRVLRGEIEMQSNQVQQIQKRQRDLYVDIDRRLHYLEMTRTGSGKAEVPPSMTGGITTTMVNSGAIVASPPVDNVAPVSKPVVVKKDGGRNELYDHALGLLREARYDDAARGFRRVLLETPNSSYTDNAQYWLAETFYVTRRFEQSLNEFQKLLDKYPDSGKRADAWLKMGYIYYELNNDSEARARLGQVSTQYAGTTAARLAEERLRRMKGEGR
ncbi:MAG: tol-pal system protein YbgF [Gammaproteobacteria bacterium]|nr:tol-pal system protein YbgF [Gammaproteobacteria bacterium]